MFKSTLKLFLALFVVKSGEFSTHLICQQTDPSKCTDKNPATLFKCLQDHIGPKQCEASKNLCLVAADHVIDGHTIILKGCAQSGDCKKELYYTLLDKKMVDGLMFNGKMCVSCHSGDNCNEHNPVVHYSKDLKGSKKESDPKKNGGNRSHRITVVHQMSILVHVLLILSPFFLRNFDEIDIFE